MGSVEGEGEGDAPWRADDDVDGDRFRELDRRRRWPWLVGVAGLVLVAFLVKGAIPVVQDEVAETEAEVERRRGVRPEEVVSDLIALCSELADPLGLHLEAHDPLDAVPEAAEVARLLQVHLSAMPLVRGQVDARRDTGLEGLASAREAIDALAASSGSAEELDELRLDAQLQLWSALGFLGLREGGSLTAVAEATSQCRGVSAALEWVLVKRA